MLVAFTMKKWWKVRFHRLVRDWTFLLFSDFLMGSVVLRSDQLLLTVWTFRSLRLISNLMKLAYYVLILETDLCWDRASRCSAKLPLVQKRYFLLSHAIIWSPIQLIYILKLAVWVEGIDSSETHNLQQQFRYWKGYRFKCDSWTLTTVLELQPLLQKNSKSLVRFLYPTPKHHPPYVTKLFRVCLNFYNCIGHYQATNQKHWIKLQS